ncbi:MAG: NTP transferase domain-containing protein [Candidatus Wildermuthbacteria bacterium]|nr:NTP transferase domain-containing protein [Candidatus Wildermuthbacteria bacterium]
MQAVIIAAGESSRFWPLNHIHKTQTYLLGKPIIYWTLKGFAEHGIQDIVIVCRPNSSMQELLEKENDLGVRISFVVQQEPLGTGNALWQAKELITKPFYVCWPNKVNAGEIIHLMEEKRKAGAQGVLVGGYTATPWDYGIFRCENDRMVEIVENPLPGKEPSNIKMLGLMYFERDFFNYYEKLPEHHEADFIDAINAYSREKRISFVALSDEAPALKYPWELFVLSDILFRSSLFFPAIAPSATIGKNVIIDGMVRIGEHTIIHDSTIITGPCFIGPDCEIGYSNVLRGPVDLERGVKTGAYMEIKHSIVQEGTHFHSGFLGDCLVGKNCRFGAGFIAANRRMDRGSIAVSIKGKKVDTGLDFFGAAIGEASRFGIHSGTMPGVLIGSHCVIGPGTHVFDNIPDNTSVVTKFANEEKEIP